MKSFLAIASAAILVLGAAGAAAIWAQEAPAGHHISVLPSELKWTPATSLAPGAEVAVIEGDLKTAAPFTFRLKLPPNSKVGVHTHPVMERVTVMSGTFYLGLGDKFDAAKAKAYPAGAVAMMPAGMPMFAYTKDEESIIQIHGTGPWGIKFLEPAKEPAARQ